MNRILIAALTALGLAAPALAIAADADATSASGPSSQAAASQMSDNQIRDQLALNGYIVQRLKHEGDKVTAYATTQNGTAKFLVDAKTGQVTQAADDDDDDDDD